MTTPENAGKERAQHRVEVADLVRAGLIEPGATLWARSKSVKGRTAQVSEDGLVWVDGVAYATPPSAAAKAVTGTQSEAGWWFWLTDPDTKASLDSTRSTYLEAADTSAVDDIEVVDDDE